MVFTKYFSHSEQDDDADDFDEEGEFQCTVEEVPECDVPNTPPIPSVSSTTLGKTIVLPLNSKLL